ncbi:GNAT family N-acetyltransferase [Pedococcus sp. 5OH_020]|uniref:GNAT family N-acetyltransferase n=1 Tax=Pedococcus sp. 5OH_020 TaxID=2989814 RepID=UPI0022EA022D|nr:GNAT family N-acetyltransferase [Pedococcus sp. 5OH_020]
MRRVEIRERVAGDLPQLVEVLTAQQPFTGYPQRWPLPFPVEQFVMRPTEEAAWVAVEGERVLGHVAVTRVEEGPEVPIWESGSGRPAQELAVVAVLFVDHAASGRGVGSLLLQRAVEYIRQSGRVPVLDVVQEGGRAASLYRRRGWQEVGQARPWWLPADHRPVLLMVLPEPARVEATARHRSAG